MTTAPGVQFIEPQTKLKFALTSVANNTGKLPANDLHMRLQYPAAHGWGSVAIGNQMEGATMFVVYPSNSGTGATLSIRTATGEEEPIGLAGLDCKTQSMITHKSIVDASFACYGVGDDARLKGKSASNWIWAVGPGLKATGPDRDSTDVYLAEHNYYGSFNLDMVKAHVAAPVAAPKASQTTAGHLAQSSGIISATASALVPMITGSTSSGASASAAASMPADNLVRVHAVILCGSFLILFPLGVLLLRVYSVRAHWIVQALASLLSFIGFMIAFAMSGMTEEHRDFKSSHQVLGIILFILMLPQLFMGWAHHMKFKKTGWGTWMAVPHLNLGRLIMFLGLVTGILGFKLSDNTDGAVVFGLSSAGMIIAIICLIVWDRKKRAKLTANHGDDRPSEKLRPAFVPKQQSYEMTRPERVYQAKNKAPLPLIWQNKVNGMWEPPVESNRWA